MTIQAVMFDLDDTLLWDERSVEESFDAVCEQAASEKGIDPAKLKEAVRAEARALYESYETFPFTKLIGINPFEGLWAHFNGGEQTEFRNLEQLAPVYRTESWRKGLERLGVQDAELAARLADQFMSERRSRPYVYEETFAVLKELKDRQFKLLLLTNGCPSLQQEKLNGVPELAPYFDHIIISGSFGKGKPDPTIFEHALSQLGVTSEEAIMVGDKLTTDIKGAVAAHIRAVWVNRNGKTNTESIQPDYEIKHLSELHDIIQTI